MLSRPWITINISSSIQPLTKEMLLRPQITMNISSSIQPLTKLLSRPQITINISSSIQPLTKMLSRPQITLNISSCIWPLTKMLSRPWITTSISSNWPLTKETVPIWTHSFNTQVKFNFFTGLGSKNSRVNIPASNFHHFYPSRRQYGWMGAMLQVAQFWMV